MFLLDRAFEATVRSKSLLERAFEATARSKSLPDRAFEGTVRSKSLPDRAFAKSLLESTFKFTFRRHSTASNFTLLDFTGAVRRHMRI